MLPVPPGILLSSDRPRDAHTGVQGPLAANLRRFLDPLCAQTSDVRRGAARALRPVADGSWAVQVQSRSSNPRLPTELQTYEVTEYGVRIYVLGGFRWRGFQRGMTPRIYVALLPIILAHLQGLVSITRDIRTRARDRGITAKGKPPSIMLIPILSCSIHRHRRRRAGPRPERERAPGVVRLRASP